MLGSRIKRFFALVLATVSAFIVLVGVRALNSCKFSAFEGERTFYLHSASSQSWQKRVIRVWELNKVRGESVRFQRGGREVETLVNEAVERYGASVVFCENAGGVVSVYAYTDKWDNAVCLNGALVNLHIAVSMEECVMGSPIIFGGF